MANNLKKLEKILETSLKNRSSVSTKVVIEDCKEESSNLQKDDFPPVFDEFSMSVPKMDEILTNRGQKGSSVSTIMSDERSCQSSVSILITDTTNVIPSLNRDSTLEQKNLHPEDLLVNKDLGRIPVIER